MGIYFFSNLAFIYKNVGKVLAKAEVLKICKLFTKNIVKTKSIKNC